MDDLIIQWLLFGLLSRACLFFFSQEVSQCLSLIFYFSLTLYYMARDSEVLYPTLGGGDAIANVALGEFW